MQTQDLDSFSHLSDYLPMFKWTFRAALIRGACQCILDDVNAAVIHNKQHNCNHDSCPYSFEKSHPSYNNENDPNQYIVNARQLEPGIIQPFSEKGQTH